jgi:hypothetical protein
VPATDGDAMTDESAKTNLYGLTRAEMEAFFTMLWGRRPFVPLR